MGKCCESCGQALPEFGGVVADDDRFEVRYNGKVTVGLTGQEYRMFRFLLDAKGQVKNKGAILDALYGHLPPADEPDIKIVDVFVCKLRKKIAPLGLELGTVWGRGYWLKVPGQPEPKDQSGSMAAEVGALTYGGV